MSDGAQGTIARMVMRGGLSAAEGRAAMWLAAVAESAAEIKVPYRAIPYEQLHVGANRHRASNCMEGQVVCKIAGQQLFEAWQVEMRERGGDAGVTIDVLLLGQTLRAVDQRMKRRNGWARGEMLRGISAFQDILVNRNKEPDLTSRVKKSTK